MGDIVGKENESLGKVSHERNSCLPASFRDKITSAMQRSLEDSTNHLIADLLRGVEVGSDLIASIKKEVVYIATIPKNLEAGVKSGELSFMQKADTGERLGAIVGSDHLNRGFVRIEEGYVPDPSLIHSLSNLAMQQQLAHMAEVIDEIRNRVVVLQETYDKGLNGSLRGMHNQLIQMRDTQDEATRKQLATQAISILNDTRGKITERLLSELTQLPETPSSSVAAALKTLFTKGFHDRLTSGYDKIQELFRYYLTATQLLAYAYFYLGEPIAYEDVFKPDNDLIKNENIKKLLLAETCVGCLDEAWYKQPELYLGRIRKEAKERFFSDSDVIEIELTGQQLLEAMQYDEAEAKN